MWLVGDDDDSSVFLERLLIPTSSAGLILESVENNVKGKGSQYATERTLQVYPKNWSGTVQAPV